MTVENSDHTPLTFASAGVEAAPGELVDRVVALVEQSRGFVAAQANAALTLMNWNIGHMIELEILKESRAEYAREIVVTLSRQLTSRFGKGFDRPNVHRMLQFAQVFPELEIVVTLSQQLGWSHFLAVLPVRTPEARDFYIDQAVSGRLSVRALRDLIGRQGFERKETANAHTSSGSTIPAGTFRDPYLLDFLGLTDTHAEQDLEVLSEVA